MSRPARGAGRRTVLLVTTSETPDTGYLPVLLNPFEPGHLDAALASGPDVDLIAALAFPLPFIVISEMLGIPEGRDRSQLREWSGAVVKTFDPILTREEILASFDAIDNINVYINEVIAWKREHSSNDLLSALIAAEDEGDRLSEVELIEQVML